MADRRKLTLLDKLKIVIDQARCPLCNEKLGRLEDLDFDHIHALVNGGADEIGNMRAVHRKDCHKVKTHGNGATNRGSDRGEASKTKRLVEKREAKETAAANLIQQPDDDLPDTTVSTSRKASKVKAKRPIQSANRWPAKKPKVPYKRRGV